MQIQSKLGRQRRRNAIHGQSFFLALRSEWRVRGKEWLYYSGKDFAMFLHV